MAIWSTSYLKGIGGAENIVHQLCNHWASLGIHTCLIADEPAPECSRPPYLVALHPNVLLYGNTFPNPLLHTESPLRFCHKNIQYIQGALGLARFLRQQRLQIMHLHFVNIDVLLLVLYKWLFKYHLVLTFTGMELELASQSRLSKFKLNLALDAADAITGVSEDICTGLRNVTRRPVRCVHNGILRWQSSDAVSLRRPGDHDHFVFCGRMTAVKRVPFLLRAFHEAVLRGCTKNLYLVGGGEDAPMVDRLIRELGLEDRVIPLGALGQPDALDMIRHSRCLVLASASEGLPMVILEAMAMGQPVIASDVGGIREVVVHGKNGWLFPPDRPDRLATLILTMAEDDSLVCRMGEEAVRTIEHGFRFETMAEHYLAVYRELLQAPVAA